MHLHGDGSVVGTLLVRRLWSIDCGKDSVWEHLLASWLKQKAKAAPVMPLFGATP